MNKSIEKFNRWMNYPYMTETLRSQLEAMRDDHNIIEEAFYKELEFGTSGLRGIMGPGSNRMNCFVVAKVTQGLSNYINESLKNAEELNNIPSVVISYDSRSNSKEFAQSTAEILSANGIRAYIFREMHPVSLLSYAIRFLKCDYGIMITASHNSKEYNGYKVYNRHGGQILGDEPALILKEINKLDIFDDVKEGNEKNVTWLGSEVRDAYVRETISKSLRFGIERDGAKPKDIEDLKVVYSPLNGSGLVPVLEVLENLGVKDVIVVPEQEKPDSNFTTCPKPNPELKEVYTLGVELMKKNKADILIVTDPDCDRIGVASGDTIFTGNQLGVLLFDYICRNKKPMPLNPVAVRSIVSTPLLDAIAEDYGVKVNNTLIGFKYIGEMMDELKNDYIFGFEEGNGYLAFNHMRDKDGVSTAMLVCEMAAEYKANGLTLEKALKKLYKKYGYYGEKVINYSFEGREGLQRREKVMDYLRGDVSNAINGYDVKEVVDYKLQQKHFANLGIGSYTKLPVSNIMEYHFEKGQKFIVRPSGTEPNLKAYIFARSKYSGGVLKKIEKMEKEITRIVNEEQY